MAKATKFAPIKGIAVKALKTRGLDLGVLQNELEASATDLKRKNTLLKAAKEAQASADKRHATARAALEAGFEQLNIATKV